MNEIYSRNPFNGKLPPIQPPRMPPTAPPQGLVPAKVEESLNSPAAPLTGGDVGHTLETQMPPGFAESVEASEKPDKAVDSEIVEDPHFTYEGYQVVRGEYFSHINEPSITFSDNRFSVNAACLKKLSDVEFVQVLVNQEQKKLAVRPCSEDVKDSFAWCTLRRKPKKVICPLFFGKIMSLMGWSQEHRYKILGKLVHSQGQYLFVFDLNSPEIYTRTMQIDENGNVKRKTSRKPSYLDNWKDHFGLPVEEHQKSLQISIFEGYALIGVKEPKRQSAQTSNNVEGTAHVESTNLALDPGGHTPEQNTNT